MELQKKAESQKTILLVLDDFFDEAAKANISWH